MTSAGHTVSAVMIKSVRYDAVKDFAPVALVADSGLRLRRAQGFPGQRHQGAGRARQGLARQAQFRQRRRRLDPALLRRIAAPAAPASTSSTFPIAARRAWSPPCSRSEVDYAVELAHAVRGQVAGRRIEDPRGRRRPRAGRPFRTCRRSPNPACRAIRSIGWYGWVYPAGTPQAIVDKTNAALQEVLARPASAASSWPKSAPSCMSRSPAEFGKHIADEVAKWKAVRDKAGIQQQ